MVLDKNIKRLLLNDLKSAQDAIYDVFDIERNNLVVEPDYIHPTVRFNPSEPEFLPLFNKHGEYMYFTRIREILECALANGTVSRELCNCDIRLPKYLTDLVE